MYLCLIISIKKISIYYDGHIKTVLIKYKGYCHGRNYHIRDIESRYYTYYKNRFHGDSWNAKYGKYYTWFKSEIVYDMYYKSIFLNNKKYKLKNEFNIFI